MKYRALWKFSHELCIFKGGQPFKHYPIIELRIIELSHYPIIELSHYRIITLAH